MFTQCPFGSWSLLPFIDLSVDDNVELRRYRVRRVREAGQLPRAPTPRRRPCKPPPHSKSARRAATATTQSAPRASQLGEVTLGSGGRDASVARGGNYAVLVTLPWLREAAWATATIDGGTGTLMVLNLVVRELHATLGF